MKTVREFVDPIVERALNNKKEGKREKVEDAAEEETLLSHLVNLTDGMCRFALVPVYHST